MDNNDFINNQQNLIKNKNVVRINLRAINLPNIFMYILLMMPITSIIKVYLAPTNRILAAVGFFILVILMLKRLISSIEAALFAYSIYIIVANCVLCKMHFANRNMLIYFPFLILFYLYFSKHFDYVLDFVKAHKRYIDFILFVWCAIILVSFAFPSSYVYESESSAFVSFAGTTFLLSPISMYIAALLILQYQLYNKKIYAFALIIPNLCILLGSTRTYLFGLLGIWLLFAYLRTKDKRGFVIVILVITIVFVLIVFLSPIKNKFINTVSRTDLGYSWLEAFTSGRSMFWTYDMKDFFRRNIFKQTFGTNINYLLYLNEPIYHKPLWAHNDYIQILSDYGYIGLIVYIFVISYLFKKVLDKTNTRPSIIITLFFTWFFIAFFNMFYTYFCATLALPFMLLSLRLKDNLPSLKNKGNAEIIDKTQNIQQV